MTHPDTVARDHTWVARLNADDETAIGEIMDAYFKDIAELALHYVRSSEVARDIAQETFIRCWEQRHNLRADTTLQHFLRRVARNRALDVLRNDVRAERLATQLGDDSTVASSVENAGVSLVETEEFATAVRRVATTLSPRVREVLLLYFEQGLAPGEIAGLLESAPATIYKQLQKAMDVLEATLGDWRDWPQ